LHDFSPWTLPNGLFWTVKVDASAVTIDGDTVTIHLVDVPVVDAFSFPPPPQAVPGISPFQLIPAKLSLDITYKRTGHPRRVRPTSHDPISPFTWAGTMWDSSNSGTFSLSYDDGSFSASGSFDSTGNFGEMGFERNGVFLRDDEGDDSENADAQPESLPHPNAPTREIKAKVAGVVPDQTARTVLLRGRAPVKVNF
jgi:hypothetical protein